MLLSAAYGSTMTEHKTEQIEREMSSAVWIQQQQQQQKYFINFYGQLKFILMGMHCLCSVCKMPTILTL